MANMFNEDGTYNKTEWKTGDKITAVKLNKIKFNRVKRPSIITI